MDWKRTLLKTSIVTVLISTILWLGLVAYEWNNFRRWFPSSDYFLPLIIIVAVSSFIAYFLFEQGKKILYKVPIYAALLSLAISLIISLVAVILVGQAGEAEAGMGLIVIPVFFLISVTLVPLSSFVIAFIIYLFKDLKKLIIFLAGIIIIIIIITSVTVSTGEECGSYEWFCWKDAALEANDPSLCDKSHYNDRCYLLIVAETKDPSICDEHWSKVNSRNDVCYTRAAKAAGDETICEKITDEYYRNSCYKQVAD